jgi:hypothetical protein
LVINSTVRLFIAQAELRLSENSFGQLTQRTVEIGTAAERDSAGLPKTVNSVMPGARELAVEMKSAGTGFSVTEPSGSTAHNQTEPPNAMPASNCFPGQHRDVV